MKRCPSCNRTYTDTSLNFCLEDGTPLISDAMPAVDPQATVRYPPPRTTIDPHPTEVYRQDHALLNQVPELAQPRPSAPQQWSPTPPVRRQKKSGTIWWVLGGLAVFAVISIGLVIMIVAIASMGSNENSNTSNGNTNSSENANANRETNTNTTGLASSYTDDFSSEKWRTGNFQFGDIWYSDDQYHMRAKEKTYLVMYAPSGEYNSEDATVRVTARAVDGIGPTSGYGLIVHGQKSSSNNLEDYALLVFTGDEPQFQIVLHKGGEQRTLVPWTKVSALRSGTSPNQLEVRSKGNQLSFYINGRYLTRVTDTENFKRGVAGLYTSENSEVVFDDLEIVR